jgi:hypothetical protein
MGYHINQIEKGNLCHPSKITEEYYEFLDACNQHNPVLELVELTDLIGAIESYTKFRYNIDLEQLIKMTRCTQSAFKSGERK